MDHGLKPGPTPDGLTEALYHMENMQRWAGQEASWK